MENSTLTLQSKNTLSSITTALHIHSLEIADQPFFFCSFELFSSCVCSQHKWCKLPLSMIIMENIFIALVCVLLERLEFLFVCSGGGILQVLHR